MPWSDVGPTHSLNQEGEDPGILMVTSAAFVPRDGKQLTNPDDATREGGQYPFINDKYIDSKWITNPMPNIAEKIIGTVVQSSAMISAQRHAAVYLSSGPAKPACQPHTIEL